MVIFHSVAHPAIDLARPPFPVEILAVPIAPQSININHCESAIALLGDFDFLCLTSIVDKSVRVK